MSATSSFTSRPSFRERILLAMTFEIERDACA